MKKTTKQPKVVIVKRPKAKPFDLSFKNTSENTKILVAIESLKVNPGWQFLTQVLKANIKHLADKIVSKQGDNGETLSEVDVDTLRIKYNYLNELLSKPDQFVKQLTRTENTKEDLDPYQS